MENQNINLLQKDEKTTKSKIVVWLSTILLGALVGLGAYLSTLNNRYLRTSAYSHNDNDYEITLSANDFNNGYYSHLNSYFVSLDNDNIIVSSVFTSFVYDDDDFLYEEYSLEDSSNYYFLYLGTDDNFISFSDSRFSYLTQEETSVSNSVIITVSETYYSQVRFAIELDLHIYPQQNWFDELISLLTGGITGIAGGVGVGVSTLVGDIFVSNGALSVFGGAIVVFAGVSLAIGLCRWVMNFLTSFGAKK